MNRRTLLSLSLLLCAATTLQAQIDTPRVGLVRYSDGTVHAVYGLPSNYVVDTHVLASADAVSFSDRGGIIARNGRILLLDSAFQTVASFESGDSAPLLNIDGDLKSAVAWLPTRRALLHSDGTSLVLTEVNGSAGLGTVTSVRLAGPHSAKLLATNADSTVSEATVSLDSGELTSLNNLPGVKGPAFSQQSFVVFLDEAGLTVANASAVLHTLPLHTASVTFERMSSDSLHLASPSTGQNWILRLGLSTPHLSQLPSGPAHLAVTSPVASQEAKQ